MVVDNVVFFDGYCHMCNRSVNWLLKRDKRHVLYFAPLQGDTSRYMIPENLQSVDSIVFCSAGKTHIKSGAFVRIVMKLPWMWKLLAIIWIIPYPIRDWGYDFIAKRRYKWYGKSESCRLPSEKEKAYFLP